jgi:hypothetical protein
MLTLNGAAHRVAHQSQHGEQEVVIDPVTVMMICSILSTIFAGMRAWCQWRQGQKADGKAIQEACVRPSFRLRRRVQRVVREQMGEDEFRQRGAEVVYGIFQAGASASPADIERLANAQYTNNWGEREQEL